MINLITTQVNNSYNNLAKRKNVSAERSFSKSPIDTFIKSKSQNSENKENKVQSNIKVNFKGKYFPSGYYDDNEIRLAKSYMHLDNLDDRWEAITDDIWDGFSWTKRKFNHKKATKEMNDTHDRVSKLIDDLKKEKKDKEANFKNKIKDLEAQLKENDDKKTQLLKDKKQALIDKNKREKAEDEKRIKEIKEKTAELKKIRLAKEDLRIEYVDKVENNIEDLPNGIMLTGISSESVGKLFKAVAEGTNSNYIKMDFNNLERENVVKEILKVKKNASKEDNKTILHIENFDRYTIPIEENDEIVPKLKSFLCKSADSNITIMVHCDNPQKLSNEVYGDHRFKVKDYTFKTKLEGKSGKYQLKYGYNDEDAVNFHKYDDSGKILWVDTRKAEDIQRLLNNSVLIDKTEGLESAQKLYFHELNDRRNIKGVYQSEKYDGSYPIFETYLPENKEKLKKFFEETKNIKREDFWNYSDPPIGFRINPKSK